jgi:hypothetical protein
MTKLLEKALEAVRKLPADSQDDEANELAQELVILAIRHPFRRRDYSDL